MKKYLIDGQFFSQEEALALFNYGRVEIDKLDFRQKVCLDMVKKALADFDQTPFLIDIGCYAGLFLEAVNILFPDIQVEGVDYFEDNIEIARLLYPPKDHKFKKMSVYKLDYQDESVDIITFQEVIEHLDRPVDAIREINRVLKKGGYLIISTPNACSLRKAVSSIFFEWRNALRRFSGTNQSMPHEVFFENIEWNRHIYSWTSFTLSTLLLANSFEYVDHKIVGVRWWERIIPGSGSVIVLRGRKIKDSPARFI
jgi:2-polyprenyl-3-methyl-5-hydroxy-6-metoxy-1,4-benzoquinol methylase